MMSQQNNHHNSLDDSLEFGNVLADDFEVFGGADGLAKTDIDVTVVGDNGGDGDLTSSDDEDDLVGGGGASKKEESKGTSNSTGTSTACAPTNQVLFTATATMSRIGVPIKSRTYGKETSPPPSPTPLNYEGTPDEWYDRFQHKKLGKLNGLGGAEGAADETTVSGHTTVAGGECEKKQKKTKGLGARISEAFINLGNKLEQQSYQLAFNVEAKIRRKHEEDNLKRLLKYFPDNTPQSFIEDQKKMKKQKFEAGAAKEDKKSQNNKNVTTLGDLKENQDEDGLGGSLGFEREQEKEDDSAATKDDNESYVCAFEVEIIHDGAPVAGHAILTTKNLCIVAKAKMKAPVAPKASTPSSVPALIASLRLDSSQVNSHTAAGSSASPSRWNDRKTVQQLTGGTRATEPFAEEDDEFIATPDPHQVAPQAVTSKSTPIPNPQNQQQYGGNSVVAVNVLISQVIPLTDIATFSYGISVLSHDTKGCTIVPSKAPSGVAPNSGHHENDATITASAKSHLQPDSIQIFLKKASSGTSSADAMQIIEIRRFMHHISNTQPNISYMVDGHAHVSFVERFVCYLQPTWKAAVGNGGSK